MPLADAGVSDPGQWTADVFWSQIQWVADQGRSLRARLDQQKLDLQNTYSAARNAGDQPRMAALAPLIDHNSQLRLRYADLASGFNNVVEQARAFLASHGINEPPTLAGLGQLEEIIVPALWVAGLIAVVAIVHELDDGIKSIGADLDRLGGPAKTALAFVPLVVALVALLYFWQKGKKAVTA
jgi:hypothetical protein